MLDQAPDIFILITKDLKTLYTQITLKMLLFAAVIGCILPSDAYCQNTNDTTLQEINIHTKRKVSNDSRINDFSPGQKVKTIDSATLHQYQLQSLASLLTQQVPVFVKSYGFNGLATLNFRGSSSAQSAVFWNGVPIQNAALGIADISTLPVSFMHKVNIVYGGSSALWGSGNVGGALMLENDAPVFDSAKSALFVNAGTGSFGQYMGGLDADIHNHRWFFSGSVYAQSAINNFTFTSNQGIKSDMHNSRLQSEAVQLRAAYKIGALQVVSLTAWMQQYSREIPPGLLESSSVKKQEDGAFRVVAEWNKVTGSNKWYARSSFVKDESGYSDDAILLHVNNSVYQYYQEVGWKKELGFWGRISMFTPFQLAWLNQQGEGSKQQSRVALVGAYDIKVWKDKLDISVSARNEIINSGTEARQSNILLPGANASFAITPWLLLRSNVQRTYRTPALNELYYFPGGNTSLKPEQGWSEDAGYLLSFKAGDFTLSHDVSVFNRNIHDWILWIGGAIWTPHNISEVHSRGVETENNISYTTGHWKFHIGLNTSYILATTVSSYIYNDGSIGKQIPYTPRYNGQANAGFTFRKLSFNYNHTYTGYRFITSDESYFITPYATGNVQLMLDTRFRQHKLRLSGQCNNIWNSQYQVVAYRPMPGTNWLLALNLGIVKEKNQ